jgi:SRSO17 transposase
MVDIVASKMRNEVIPKNETRTQEATWTIDETSDCKWDTSELSQITLRK